MPQTFALPDLGEGLTEAELVTWLVAVGDTIEIDQAIAEVETAKSIVELPSPFAGTVVALHGAVGETIPVGAPVLEVAEAAAGARPATAVVEPEPLAEAPSVPDDDPEKEAYRQEERAGAGSGNVLIGYGTSGQKVSRRRRGRVERPRLPVPGDGAGPLAVRSPVVRSLAKARGVDLRAVIPTGDGGVITRADVERALPTSDPTALTTAEIVAGLPVARRAPLGMLRRTVAAKLSRSRAEIPEATVWVDVDATDLWALRTDMALDGRSPSFTAIMAKFALLALAEYPVLAGRLSEDGTELIEFDGVNLGIAADTPRGLMVPVLRAAHRLTLGELDTELRRVAEEARAGGGAPEDLTGSTFTLNNYGSFGVDGSAAIINHPEVAILGVGRMIERPWVVGGAIVARRIAQLSLVFDHRVCDGGYAAGFLRHVTSSIEHPARAYSRI